MSGVTDLPFRQLRAFSGRRPRHHGDGGQRAPGPATATACANGQLAGILLPSSYNWRAARRAGWRKGRAWREQLGADIIDINMGCPAREVTGKLSGSALMRDLDHAAGPDRGGRRRRRRARDAEDAHSAGTRRAATPRARAARRGRRRAAHHRPRPHPLPVLQGRAPTGPSCAASRRRCASPSSSTATSSIRKAPRPRSTPPAPTP